MMRVERKIRVGQIITNFVLGGAQDYLLAILRGLDHRKFEVFVAGRLEGERYESLMSTSDIRVVDIPSLRREIRPFDDLRAVYQIKKFCEDFKLDIVHTHSSKPGVVGRLGAFLAGVPIIVHTIHGFPFHDFMPAVERRTLVVIERLMASISAALLFVSSRDKNYANQLGIRARHESSTIYNGIDFSPFRVRHDRAEVRRSMGFAKKDIIVGFSGRLSEQKGVTILVEGFSRAFRKDPRLHLLLIGDGPLRSQLENQIQSLNIADNVTILGYRSDIARLLAVVDVFLMPSLWEGLSRSLGEAMYSRIPVIATDVGGTADAVRPGETGVLIPPNDSGAIERELISFLKRNKGRKQMVERAYRWSRKAFDISTMQRKISAFYCSLYAATNRNNQRTND